MKNKIVLVIIMISLIFITIGYAYLNTTLGMKGNIFYSDEIKPARQTVILGQTMTAYKDNMKSPYVTSTTGINFAQVSSDTNGKGLYLLSNTENDPYPIYYFRGEVNNNHVIFGGFCWKIVRTTEQGGTKIIYDGKPNNNQCNNTGTSSQIGTSAFNTGYNTLADVGYMYGTRYTYTTWTDASYVYGSDVTYANGVYTLSDTSPANTIVNVRTKHYTCKLTTNGTCSTVYYVYSFYNNSAFTIALTNGNKLEDIINNSYANTNDSSIKKVIDNWFKTNLASQESKLEDAVWCNDRTITSGGYLKNADALVGTYFGATGNRNLYSTTTPKPQIKDKLTCQNQGDRFTKNDTKLGNGKLTYPVGLMTADELTITESVYPNINKNSYLYTGQTYWLMTPCYTTGLGYWSNGFAYLTSGDYYDIGVHHVFGVRPMVVLKNDIVAKSGNGTSTSPYIIE